MLVFKKNHWQGVTHSYISTKLGNYSYTYTFGCNFRGNQLANSYESHKVTYICKCNIATLAQLYTAIAIAIYRGFQQFRPLGRQVRVSSLGRQRQGQGMGYRLYIVECITFEHLNTTRISCVLASTVGAVVGISGGMLGCPVSMLSCTTVRFSSPYIQFQVCSTLKKKTYKKFYDRQNINSVF